jgi:hypothetical protein
MRVILLPVLVLITAASVTLAQPPPAPNEICLDFRRADHVRFQDETIFNQAGITVSVFALAFTPEGKRSRSSDLGVTANQKDGFLELNRPNTAIGIESTFLKSALLWIGLGLPFLG